LKASCSQDCIESVSVSVYLGTTINKHQITQQKKNTLEQRLFCSQDV